jgi:hypothetical protein
MKLLNNYENRYAGKKKQLSSRVAQTVQSILRPHWQEALSRASNDGDLAGKLREVIDKLDPDLRRLAQALPSTYSEINHKSVEAFLNAETDEERLDEFYAFANSLIAHPDTQENLENLHSWLRQWGEQYIGSIRGERWQESDEAKLFWMLRLVRPWQTDATQDSWQSFAATFKARIIERIAKAYWNQQSQKPQSCVLLNKILAELALPVLEHLPVTNEGVPDLEEADKLESVASWAEYIAQYGERGWRKSIEQKPKPDKSKKGSIMHSLRPAFALLGILILLAGAFVGGAITNGAGLFSTPTPNTGTDIPSSREPEPSKTPEEIIDNGLTTVAPSNLSAEIKPPWACDAGLTSRQLVTVTNTSEQETTYSIKIDQAPALPEGFQIWRVENEQPACETESDPLAESSFSMQAEETIFLIVSYPNVIGDGKRLTFLANDNVLADVELTPWEGEITVDLVQTTEQTTFIVETGNEATPLTVSYNLVVNVPGIYQFVCLSDGGEALEAETITFSYDEVQTGDNKDVSCQISQPGNSPGNWQASVYPVFEEGTDAVMTDDSSALNKSTFTIELARHSLEISQLGEPVGLIWGPKKEGSNNLDVGFVLTYVITNTGNLSDDIFWEVIKESGIRNTPWDFIITVITSTEQITGTFEQTISPDNDIILRLTDDSIATFPITQPLEVSGDSKTYRLTLPGGTPLSPCLSNAGNCPTMYIAIWINANRKNSVDEEPVNFLFRAAPFSAPGEPIEKAVVIDQKPERDIVVQP